MLNQDISTRYFSSIRRMSMPTGSNTRIFFFTSPIGLGHATRDIAIAEKLVKLGKGKENIRFITGKHAFKLISNRSYFVSDLYKPKDSLYNQVSYIIHL